MSIWNVTIEVFPHQSGEGKDQDQKACGPRWQFFEIPAEPIAAAVAVA